MQSRSTHNSLAWAFVALSSPALIATSAQADDEQNGENTLVIQNTMVTAEQEAKQALGSSIITAEDIKRHPPANDLSDIIRREPGVNLTATAPAARAATTARSTCAAWARKTP